MWPNSQPNYSWGPYMAQPAGGFGNNDQVDWATLAKQWMQHRDMVGLAPSQEMHRHSASNDNEASQNQVWFPPAGCCAPQQQQTVIFSDMENYNSIGSTTQSVIQQPSEVTSNRCIPPWAVPPPPPPLPEPVPESHINNITLDEHNFNANQFDQNSFPVMWNQPSVPVAPPKIFNQPRSDFNFSPAWMSGTTTGAADNSFLDANKRKMLPAWIREGLEKMERQKFKQMERERMEQSVISDDTEFENQISAFHSQEEEEECEKEYEDDNEVKPVDVVEDVIRKEKEEEKGILSEEEKLARLMLKVRRMMTEILLEVTNEEISSISDSVYLKAKSRQSKAPTQALVSSSALASISALGGDYESEVEDDEEVEGNQDDSSSDEDIEVAREKIEKKRAAFDARMKLLEFEDEKKEENKPKHSESTTKDPVEASYAEKVDLKSKCHKQEFVDKKLKNLKKNDTRHSKSKRTLSTSSSSSSSSNSESDTSSSSVSSSEKRLVQKKKEKEKPSKNSKEKAGKVAERKKRSSSRSRVSQEDNKKRMSGKLSRAEHSRRDDRLDKNSKSWSSERYSKRSSTSLRNENKEDRKNDSNSESDRNKIERRRDSTGERRRDSTGDKKRYSTGERRKRKRSEDRADSEERNTKKSKKERDRSRRYEEKMSRRESRRESRSR